jgi:hypothetical protein
MNQHPIIKNNCFFPTFTMLFPLVFTKVFFHPHLPGAPVPTSISPPSALGFCATTPAPRRRRPRRPGPRPGHDVGRPWEGASSTARKKLGFTGEIFKTWWFQMVQDNVQESRISWMYFCLEIGKMWFNMFQSSKRTCDLPECWPPWWVGACNVAFVFCGLSIAAERCRNLCYINIYINMTQKCCEITRLPYVTPAIYYHILNILRSSAPNMIQHQPLSTPNWVVQRRRTGSTWNASASGFSHFSSVKSIGGIGHFQIQQGSTFTCT